MNKRDFSAESRVNYFLRFLRAFTSRLRGLFFRSVGMFSDGSGWDLVFGSQPRFINTKSMWLGKSVHFGVMARLECYNGFNEAMGPRISIGDGCSFGDYCHIGAVNYVSIGRNVLGASRILIIDHNHGDPKSDIVSLNTISPKMRELTSNGPINIGDNVWIGEGVVILAGSSIGDAAIISAHSIVRGKVPERTIYFGR